MGSRRQFPAAGPLRFAETLGQAPESRRFPPTETAPAAESRPSPPRETSHRTARSAPAAPSPRQAEQPPEAVRATQAERGGRSAGTRARCAARAGWVWGGWDRLGVGLCWWGLGSLGLGMRELGWRWGLGRQPPGRLGSGWRALGWRLGLGWRESGWQPPGWHLGLGWRPPGWFPPQWRESGWQARQRRESGWRGAEWLEWSRFGRRLDRNSPGRAEPDRSRPHPDGLDGLDRSRFGRRRQPRDRPGSSPLGPPPSRRTALRRNRFARIRRPMRLSPSSLWPLRLLGFQRARLNRNPSRWGLVRLRWYPAGLGLSRWEPGWSRCGRRSSLPSGVARTSRRGWLSGGRRPSPGCCRAGWGFRRGRRRTSRTPRRIPWPGRDSTSAAEAALARTGTSPAISRIRHQNRPEIAGARFSAAIARRTTAARPGWSVPSFLRPRPEWSSRRCPLPQYPPRASPRKQPVHRQVAGRRSRTSSGPPPAPTAQRRHPQPHSPGPPDSTAAAQPAQPTQQAQAPMTVPPGRSTPAPAPVGRSAGTTTPARRPV